jgi:light-regulated signal transduction histidine kinase (bacteriophytochrome)
MPGRSWAQLIATDQTHSGIESSSAGRKETFTIRTRTQPTDAVPSIAEQETGAPTVSTFPVSEGSTVARRYITNRFAYAPKHNGPSTTIFTTAGEKTYRCEDEPIRIPGAIQRFGVLIGVRKESDGSFLVRIVSENAGDIINLDPETLFQLPCFTDLLTSPGRHEFMIRANAMHAENPRSSPDVFSVTVASGFQETIRLFCAMHFNAESNLIICEFEVDQDVTTTPDLPEDSFPLEPIEIIHNDATEEERLLSTTCRSKPLHSLEIVRASSRQLALMDTFQISVEIQDQLAAAQNLTELCDSMVGLVRDLTGFHRVMVYQFDDTAAGTYCELIKSKSHA